MDVNDYLLFGVFLLIVFMVGLSFLLEEEFNSKLNKDLEDKEPSVLVEEDFPYKIVGCKVYKNDYLNERWVLLGETSC